jgi:hypothetical protein
MLRIDDLRVSATQKSEASTHTRIRKVCVEQINPTLFDQHAEVPDPPAHAYSTEAVNTNAGVLYLPEEGVLVWEEICNLITEFLIVEVRKGGNQ